MCILGKTERMKALIQIASPSMEATKTFYEKANFKSIPIAGGIYFYSNPMIVYLKDDPCSRAGLRLFNANWERFIVDNGLENQYTKTKNGYIILSPEGCPIYLDLTDELYINCPNEEATCNFGNYAGLSLESVHIHYSIEFWQNLGFKITMGDPSQGWVALKNEFGFTLSIMAYQACPHLFPIPSISFFNSGKNIPIIEKIKESNIDISEEITRFNKDGVVDNIIVKDPGGLGYFIFND